MILSKPTKEEVNAIDLSYLRENITNDRALDFYNGEAGIEHYKLLAWIGLQYDEVLLCEIGCLDGCGAIALAHNELNEVVTYDITEHQLNTLPSNAKRVIIKLNEFPVEVLRAKFIHYDASHNGTEERWFLDELVRRGWKGIVMFDDIDYNEPMRAFWKSVTQRKEDWTDIGHFSGTGLVWLG